MFCHRLFLLPVWQHCPLEFELFIPRYQQLKQLLLIYMKIEINNVPDEVSEGIVLEQLLSDKGLLGNPCAVAVNGRVIKRSDYASYQLHAGDKLLLIEAAKGG